jgi:hypothetical protein
VTLLLRAAGSWRWRCGFCARRLVAAARFPPLALRVSGAIWMALQHPPLQHVALNKHPAHRDQALLSFAPPFQQEASLYSALKENNKSLAQMRTAAHFTHF